MDNHGARSMKVLVPGFSEKLRISDELAECFHSGDGGAGMKALLLSPFGTAVWHVEVSRDGEGAFLGRRWREFVEAHGIGLGWFVVLRHEGRGVLTVKAFDANGFIKEFGQTLTVPGLPEAHIETGRARRPQFIRLLWHEWMAKMPIPSEFLKRRYISDEELNSRMASFVTPLRNIWHIDLEKDGSSVFFAGDWSKFLQFHGIAEGEAVLIRYQGNMIFTIEVFGFTGCQRKLKKQGIRFQQTENSEEINSYQKTENSEDTNSYQKTENSEETNASQRTEQSQEANSSQKTKQSEEVNSSQNSEPSEEPNSSQNSEESEEPNSSQNFEETSKDVQSQKEAHILSRKRKRNEGKKMPKTSIDSLDRRRCVPSQLSMRKKLTTYALERYLSLPRSFTMKVGLQKKCKITLKSSASNRSWKLDYLVHKTSQCDLSGGWKKFCRDNGLKEGDVCTFNVIKRKLWSVDIERC